MAQLTQNSAAGAYFLSLLYPDLPTWEPAAVEARLQQRCGEAQVTVAPTAIHHFQVHHFGGELDPAIPPRTLVFKPDAVDGAATQKALRQTWDWSEAASTLTRCQTSVLIADQHSHRLPYRVRLALIRQVAATLLETSDNQANNPCLGVHAPMCQLLVNPTAFLQSLRVAATQSDQPDYLCGVVNVRLFDIEDQQPGDRVMDTLGLGVLGLPDLQCHFNGIDAREMALLLLNYAYHVFEKGDVFQDGHRVEGMGGVGSLECRHEMSLAEPERVVIDLIPGPEFAAFGR